MKLLFAVALRTSILLPSILFFALGCAADDDVLDTARTASTSRAIINGVADTGHPYVALLLIDASGGVAQSICTAFVVGQRTLLTTAHCCKPQVNNIIQLDKKNYPVVKATRHPSWSSYYKNDIGLVQVQNPLPVSPAVAGTVLPSKGWKVTLVGYGRVVQDVPPDGVKRKAVNTIENVNATDKYFTTVGASGGEGNSLTGDSGGPVLASINGKEVVVGVISQSQDLYGTKSFHVTINPFISWLVATSGGDFYRPPQPKDGSSPPTDSGSSSETGIDLEPGIDADIDAATNRREIYDDGCSMGNGFRIAQSAPNGHDEPESAPSSLILIILLYLRRIRKNSRCQPNI